MYLGDYAAYKQALKKKYAARREFTSKMTDAQRKDYKHRLRVLQAARTAIRRQLGRQIVRPEEMQLTSHGAR